MLVECSVKIAISETAGDRKDDDSPLGNIYSLLSSKTYTGNVSADVNGTFVAISLTLNIAQL